MLGHIKTLRSKHWRLLLLALLFSPLAVLADQVLIKVGMDTATAAQLLVRNGGWDMTDTMELIEPKGRWLDVGLYWWFRDFDAVITVTAVQRKITQMTFWSKADFVEGKVHRAKTEHKISTITLDTKSKKIRVSIIDPPVMRLVNKGGQRQIEKTPAIQTIFGDDAELTSQEVSDVLSLARQCGIRKPAEVRTFHYIIQGGAGVTVKGVERIQGANITFDAITIRNTGWSEDTLSGEAKRVGSFWAEPDQLYITHIRLHTFRGEKIRVELEDDTPAEFADQVISAMAARKYRFPDEKRAFDFVRQEMEELVQLKPNGLSKWVDGKAVLHFQGIPTELTFRFEHGEVIFESIIRVVG